MICPWKPFFLTMLLTVAGLAACQARSLTPEEYTAVAGPDAAKAAGDVATSDAAVDSAADGLADATDISECTEDKQCAAWPCHKAYCKVGRCVAQVDPDGSACDVANLCVVGKVCSSGKCTGGKQNSCDDDNACTTDSCVEPADCQHVANSGGLCDDKVACTGEDHCTNGVCGGKDICTECKKDDDCVNPNKCAGPSFCNKTSVPYKCEASESIKVCPDVTPGDCNSNVCDPKDGLCKEQIAADKTPCSDNIPCTVGDKCLNGQCKFDTNTCGCLDDKGCMDKFFSGNYCKGVWFCDKGAANWTCKQLSQVKCPTDEDTECRKFTCDASDGNCKFAAAPDATKCTDGDKCWSDTACMGGKCANSVDGQKICLCKTAADCKAKEDGDLCNGTLICQDGQCVVNPVSVIVCPKSTDGCMKTICNKKAGKCEKLPIEALKTVCLASDPNCGDWVAIPPGATPTVVACDDGDPCTVGEVCGQGQCAATAKGYVCDCSKDDQCLKSDSANLCKGTHFCDKALSKCLINPLTVVVCDTGLDTICQKNTCVKTSGKCEIVQSCDDDNPCTADSCADDVCKHVALADGLVCGNGLACKGGLCLSK